MTVAYPAAELAYGIGLLERALSYALGAVRELSGDPLIGPTPCERWNLRQLVCHLNESLAALQEGIEGGCVSPPEPEIGAADPVIAFRQAATRLLGCWASSEGEPITVAGCPLTAITVATTGAIEVAAHGWDVSQATGRRQPIPAALATDRRCSPRPSSHRRWPAPATAWSPSSAATPGTRPRFYRNAPFRASSARKGAFSASSARKGAFR
jgi:uncharacterized protein (TIGR03086 family)